MSRTPTAVRHLPEDGFRSVRPITRGLTMAVRRLWQAAAVPVSGGSVAAFRIIFGAAMITNNVWYLRHGRVYEYYVEPDLNFPYGFATFVDPLPGVGMYLVFWAMAALGALIALGLWYRAAVVVYFVLTTYKFLIDTTYFQNHDYLISLLAFLLILIPADRMWSMDARRNPNQASGTVPSWAVWLLRFQMGIVYVYGAVAKLNADWLRGEPLRTWLAQPQHEDLPVLGPHLTNETVVWSMVYGSLVFDLFVVVFLLWRRTRAVAFLVALAFHYLNYRLFGLVIFPWLMMGATTIYFRPDWPQHLAEMARRRSATFRNLVPAPVRTPPPRPQATQPPPRPRLRPILGIFLALWVATQSLLPLRHYLIEGNSSWTEEGHRFAWHMKLRGKDGAARFLVTKDDDTWAVDPSDYLDGDQLARLAGHPERLVLFARFLSDEHDGAEVRAQTRVSLNGRPYTQLVDPAVDLSEESPLWLGHADWIIDDYPPLPDPDASGDLRSGS